MLPPHASLLSTSKFGPRCLDDSIHLNRSCVEPQMTLYRESPRLSFTCTCLLSFVKRVSQWSLACRERHTSGCVSKEPLESRRRQQADCARLFVCMVGLGFGSSCSSVVKFSTMRDGGNFEGSRFEMLASYQRQNACVDLVPPPRPTRRNRIRPSIPVP